MRDARPEGSPYPKADLTLRGLARLADFALAFVLAQTAPQVGPVLAAFYLLVADGLMHGQSVGKRIFGVRTVVIPRRAPAGYHESVLRNAPFALVAVFWAVPLLWPLLIVAGLPIVGFEAYMIFTDRLGIRIGDIFADTQVVDAKVLAKDAAVARPLTPVAPAPPSSSSASVSGGGWPPRSAAA
ncbi:MAG TPA: RDD family protein [Anaeromyxobacter sp.]|nr:RDD family protein [Anaeromyxobacter sp.]